MGHSERMDAMTYLAKTARVTAREGLRAQRRLISRSTLVALLFLLPSLIGFGIYVAWPLIFGVYAGFTDYRGLSAPKWVGLENYIKLFTKDDTFWRSLRVSLLFVFILTPANMLLGLLVALGLNRPLPLRSLARTAYYMPSLVSGVGTTLVWRVLLDYEYGIVNQVIRSLGGEPVGWLNVDMLMNMFWSVTFMSVWRGFGSTMLIYLAGLQSAPQQLYDAAKVDGANRFQRFLTVTVPAIQPMTFFLLIGQVMANMNTFTPIYVLASSTIDSTYARMKLITIPIYVYQTVYFYLFFGYGTAIGWVVFALLFAFTFMQFRRVYMPSAQRKAAKYAGAEVL
jgi:oligogalacturonide transport system permease protein